MKRFTWVRLFLICTLFFQPKSLMRASAQALPLQGLGPQVTFETGGVGLEWTTPPLRIAQTMDGYSRLEITGYALSSIPGQPELPQSSALLAIPPGAQPIVTLLAVQSGPLYLPGQVQIAPQPAAVNRSSDGEVLGGAYEAVSSSIFQTQIVSLEEIGIQRGVRLARVVFSPLQWQDATWQFVEHVQARVSFGARGDLEPLSSSANQDDPILEQLRRSVLNPAQMIPEQRPLLPSMTVSPEVVSHQAALFVKDRGLTEISYDLLKDAGFPVDALKPQLLQLWHDGAEAALEWEGNADNIFTSGERFLFYANPAFSRWMDSDIYWLKVGTQPGKRMASREGGLVDLPVGEVWQTLLVEKNLLYTPDCLCGDLPLARDGDRWVWDALSQPGRPSRSYDFSVLSVDPHQPGKLTIWMIGKTSLQAPVDHRVGMDLNAINLGFLEWDGKSTAAKTLEIPAGLLKSGQNTLTLTVPVLSGVEVDGVWLDGFQVQYAQGGASLGTSAVLTGETHPHAYTVTLDQTVGLRIYDVQDPEVPVRLTNIHIDKNQVRFGDYAEGNRQYALATEEGLRQPVQVRLGKNLQTSNLSGADYLIITHPDFAPALAPLLQLRTSQGLVAAVEDVEAIYDTYGLGHRTPDAIRAFLADVYQRWTPRPLYVLLVGDGANDPKQYHADSAPTWIPPMLADVDPWMGETAADNRFVTVDGADNLPDMAIGRLPVNSLAETQAVVTKLVGYETRADPGTWVRQLTVVADDAEEGNNFPQLSDHLVALLPSLYRPVQIYYQPNRNTSSDVQQTILKRFREGSGVIIYTGHASIHQWAAENFFHISQVPLLDNAGKLPLLLEMDCLTASFQVAGYATLDEALLRAPEGESWRPGEPLGWELRQAMKRSPKAFCKIYMKKGRGGLAWRRFRPRPCLL